MFMDASELLEKTIFTDALILECSAVSIKVGKAMSVAATSINKFTNFSNWFDEVVFQARIVDARFPVKGFLVYLENGMFIIDKIRRGLEELLIETGHKPMMFPLVTTDELFSKEAEHIKGFSAEVFIVERAGDNVLDRKLIIRPTSETIMYPMFKLWIRSHADLPLKVFQSVNVYRYETKATRPLYRAREFPWNEGHTAHATAAEAEQQVREAVEIYSKVLRELGISYILLKRPEFDKFAGAKYSIAFDAWNPDGRVNQVATVHNLGRNFSRVYEIYFEQKDGSRALVYQTCYGLGFGRVLAAVISQHGDDRGCVFPPWVAPVQVVIVPIPFKGQEGAIISYAKKVYEVLKEHYRCVLDDREDVTPGEKFYHWERMGVPVRVEVGPKEVVSNKLTLFRRDTFERYEVELGAVREEVESLMSKIMNSIRDRSARMMEQLITDAKSVEDVKDALNQRKIARVEWCGKLECAEKIKENAGGEIRGSRFDIVEVPHGNCIVCGERSEEVVYIARAY